LANGVLISEGAWGTELQARGLTSGTNPDTWNLSHPEQVEGVAHAYVEAGSQVILTNSFRANAIAMHDYSAADLDAINRSAVTISKRAAGTRALVFASIGPAGKMLLSGEVSAEELTAAFSAQGGACSKSYGAASDCVVCV
jgi:methionine synthase I (cobalamin-dependent)